MMWMSYHAATPPAVVFQQEVESLANLCFDFWHQRHDMQQQLAFLVEQHTVSFICWRLVL